MTDAAAHQEKRWGKDKRSLPDAEQLIDLAPNIVIGLGQGYKILIFNKYAEKLLGYKAKKVLGKNFIDFLIPRELRDELYKVLDNIVKEQSVEHSYESPVIAEDGRGLIIAWKISVVTENGVFKMVFSIGEDITEKKTLQDKLRLIRFTIDHSASPVYWINQNAELIYTNEAACTALGCEEEKLLKMRVFDIDPSFSEESWAKAWTEIKRKKHMVVESTHRRIDGKEFPVQVTGNFISFDSKEFVVTQAIDITERKKKERELEEKIREFERINKLMIDRELRMSELKQEVARYKEKYNNNLFPRDVD